MNDMTPIQKGSPLQRYSAGEISRHQLERLLDQDVSFGDALLMLHAENLPLPRRIPKRDSGGVAMLERLLKRT